MKRVERVAKAIYRSFSGGDPNELVMHPASKSWEEPSMPAWMRHEDNARAAIRAIDAAERADRKAGRGRYARFALLEKAVEAADVLRQAQRTYLSDRTEANGAAVGAAARAYDEIREKLEACNGK